MATKGQKRQGWTHVRARQEKVDRAHEVALQEAAQKKREKPHYTYVIDEILEAGLARREKKLGIKIPA